MRNNYDVIFQFIKFTAKADDWQVVFREEFETYAEALFVRNN